MQKKLAFSMGHGAQRETWNMAVHCSLRLLGWKCAVEWVSPTDSYSTVLEMLHLPCLLSISVAVAVFVWLGLLRFMIGCINKSFAAMLCLCLFQCV